MPRLHAVRLFPLTLLLASLACGGRPMPGVIERPPAGGFTRTADQAPPCPTPAEDATLTVYDSTTVDRPVVAGAGVLPPPFPQALRARGQTGVVLAEFTVNRTGCVEPASVVFREVSAPPFQDAVGLALSVAQFEPAQQAGAPVRQRLAMRFVFDLQR